MYSHKISIYVGIICALFNALQVSEIQGVTSEIFSSQEFSYIL